MAYASQLPNVVQDILQMTQEEPIIIYLHEFNQITGLIQNGDTSHVHQNLEQKLKQLAETATSKASSQTTRLVRKLAILALKSSTNTLKPTERFTQDLIEIALEIPDSMISTTVWATLPRDYALGAGSGYDNPYLSRNSTPITGTPKTPSELLCAHCGKPATSSCAGCKDTCGQKSENPTVYCNSECQKADWKDHKEKCKQAQDVKKVSRAARILQSLFYVLQKHVFCTAVQKVEEKHGILYIYSDEKGREIRKHNFPAWPFPKIPGVSAEDEKTLMSVGSCYSYMTHSHELIKYFMQGLCTDIRESAVKLKRVPRPTSLVLPDGRPQNNMFNRHSILKLTLKSEQHYCLDITGAQFGFTSPLTPWRDFETNHILMHRDEQAFGTADAEARRAARNMHDARSGERTFHLEVNRIFLGTVVDWMGANVRFSVGELLGLSEERFEVVKGALVEGVEGEFGRRLAGLEGTGKYVYMFVHGEPRLYVGTGM